MASHLLPGAVSREYIGPDLAALLRELADDLDREDKTEITVLSIAPSYDDREETHSLVVTWEK